jgi:hypothetical protein
MVEIISKENKRYVLENVRHNSEGVIFEYLKEMVLLSHKDIKSMNWNYQKNPAKTYRNK